MSEMISVAIFQIQSPLETPFRAFAQWRKTRETRKALNALSDIELQDIGIERGEIEAVVRRAH